MATTSATMKLTEPAVTDKVGDSIPALAANFGIIDALYPVGTIYQSTKSTNPSTFIGGTWTSLEGRFLVGAGTTYPSGTTGGEATHTLTTAEMPSHTHQGIYQDNIQSDGGVANTLISITKLNAAIDCSVDITRAAGGGEAHNNLPPYKAVYMWERTA